jgi:prepilin-type N-terminal cleavage/methylation domain-containing protein
MNKKGFTMIELTVTLAILGIISAIGIPSYFSWLPKYRLQTSVRNIYDDLNMARSRAVRTGTLTVVKFDPANNTYTVFLDTSSPVNWDLDSGETVLSNGLLANGVDITGTTFSFHRLGFNDRGMPAAALTGADDDVYLTNSSGLFLGVRVTSAGGLSIISSTDSGSTWS